MSDVLTDAAADAVRAGNAEPGAVLAEMTEYGRDEHFPIVGPDAGRFLRLLARLTGARRVFEFGSGFGYSAAWFADALPADGELVLTDFDETNLEKAREFLERTGDAEKCAFEAGDAFETFDARDGPYDLVFVDCQKTRYADALDRAIPELRDGGLVVADNVLDGPVTPEEMRKAFHGRPPSDAAAGIAEYVENVRSAPFETAIVPLGEGLSVSRYSP
ncbi:O-methyltransferase [Salarchaeum sp. JOR-1]|uniref:O-methyltransferase n=1 Tax=Salarchaeum sp. JOR-1 TaxID=2599399 RepID=UPI0011982DDC|nr:O-methyltransferase [Salarchaeum sp. JOR-1]QDX39576.1 O-methyltransferase [Salarchaeum sp. JOR-1]